MSNHIWGIIGILVALLTLGIPIGFGLKSLMKEILAILKSVKSLMDEVQKTLNTIHGTVNRMSAFIDANERQHAEMRNLIVQENNRIVDKIDHEGERITDKLTSRSGS